MKRQQNESRVFLERRRFLKILTMGAALGIPVGWGCSSDSDLIIPDPIVPGGIPLTPAQTEGPFYPVPTIEQQMFNDTDLTRKMPADELAQGQIIVIEGTVMDQRERPLPNSIVEIWQASASGLYNHPQDAANDPTLDAAFQFWGRAITREDGSYGFMTIIPGEYDGRAARHIHFRVDSPGFRRLSTQSYFASFGTRNAADGLYNALNSSEKQLVTVEFAEFDDQPWRGSFDIVLAEA